MTNGSGGSAYARGDPRQQLSRARELTRRVREAQRATWFPLLLFAAVTFAYVPVARYGHYALTCREVGRAGEAGTVCSIYSTAGFVYWPIAFVLAYMAISAFYVHRSRARGVGTRVRSYVTAGIIVATLVTCASLWAAHHPLIGDILGLHLPEQWGFFYRLAASAIGLALLVLAWAERNRALLVFTLGYLAVALVPITFGWTIAHPLPWSFLPHVIINGGVLLLGGVGFALAERPARLPST